MDKNIQIQKNYTSAAKRTLTVRLLYVLVAVISIVVMILFIFPSGEAECDVYLSSYNRYINFSFDRYVKEASVQVKFIDRSGITVGDETYNLKEGSEFRRSLTDGNLYFKVDRIVVSDVQAKLGFDSETMSVVYTICIAFMLLSVYGIVTTRCKKMEVDGYNVEIYNGPLRRYIACDGVIVAHNAKGYLMHSKEEAVVGSYLLKVSFFFYGKIGVEKVKLAQSGQESAENKAAETVEGTPDGSEPAVEMTANGAAEWENAEEKNALPVAEEGEKPPVNSVLIEENELKKRKKSKEALVIRTIYAVTIFIILALAGGAIALFAIGAFYVFPIILLMLALLVGLGGFKCRYKVYDIKGHEVILYSGIIRRYIRVDGEIEESAGVSKETRTVVLNAHVDGIRLEAVFSGYRYMDLKVLSEENN